MFDEFPFLNEYDELEEGITNTLHIASAGMLGRTLLHIAIGEVKNNDHPNSYETAVNLSVDEAKIVSNYIQAFITFNEGKPWSEDLEGHGIRFKRTEHSQATLERVRGSLMTDDIVTRLRQEWEYGNNAKGCDYEMFSQAADEIEHLRRTIKVLEYTLETKEENQ